MTQTKFTLVLATLAMLISALAPGAAQAQVLLAGRPLNASNSSKSGGVRGECPASATPLMALMPEGDPGHTTQAYPTFWFYLPFGRQTFLKGDGTTQATVALARFVLLDDKRKPILNQRMVLIPLPEKPGIGRFTLPTTEKGMEVGKDYQWYFSIICDPQQPSANPTVSGWLTRVSPPPTLGDRLKSTPAPDQFRVYQDNKLWFESLNQLVSHRNHQTDSWVALLKTFGLQEFSREPINELKPIVRR